MAVSTGYNAKSPAVRRLMKEAAELSTSSHLFHAQPIDDNLFEWHFTVRGPPDSEFAAGIYHGRIMLPPEYPMKPPSIILLTPNGRFELNKKICLSISGHHPESWQPSWSIRTALLALVGFMPTPGVGAIGSLDYTPEERKILAKKSQDWYCDVCKKRMEEMLPQASEDEKQQVDECREARELANQISFKDESLSKDTSSASINSSTSGGDSGQISTPTSSQSRLNLTSSNAPQASPLATNIPPPTQSAQQAPPAHRTAAAFDQTWNPILAPTFDQRPREDSSSERQTTSTMMIVLISIMIAALVLRRIYIMTEWRFHGSDDGIGPHRDPGDEL